MNLNPKSSKKLKLKKKRPSKKRLLMKLNPKSSKKLKLIKKRPSKRLLMKLNPKTLVRSLN